MASLVVNQGLQIIAERTSIGPTGGTGLQRRLQSMSADDGAAAFVAGDTNLASPANLEVKTFDATPTRSAQTTTHISTYTTAEANFEIKRFALHNDVQANVNGTSTTLFGGIDGQAITKTADFEMTVTIQITYSDNS